MALLSLTDTALARLSNLISCLAPSFSPSNQAGPSVPSGPRLFYTLHGQQHLIIRSQLKCLLLRKPFRSGLAKNGPDLPASTLKPLISPCIALTILEISIFKYFSIYPTRK